MNYQQSKNNFLRKQRTERRKFALDKLGNKCVYCGETKWLQFDHINPKTKLFAIGSIWSTKWDIFITELNKCQLLCKECHLKKTILEKRNQIPWNKGRHDKAKHGKMWMYYKHKCRCDLCRAYKHQQYLKYG